MMELFNDINIKCDACQRTIIIDKQMIDFESFSYDHGENAMGEEIEYVFQDEIECTCGNIISFRISAYEYPVGAYNYDDNEIYGGIFEKEPEIGIIYHSEDFDCFLAESEYDRIDLLIRDILDDINLFYAVSPREFEQIVERFFKNEGFETVLTPQTRDGGKDIIDTKYIMGKPIVFYVECKKYSNTHKVGVSFVERLYGVQMNDKVNKVMLITTSKFTSGARKFAEKQNVLIDLIDIDDFHTLLRKSYYNL